MFDNNSFSNESFDNRSWLVQITSVVTRFVIRIASTISTIFSAKSEVQ